MTDFPMKLSAYLDGELSDEESKIVENRLASDPQAVREMEALISADALAKNCFNDLLEEPISFALAQQIRTTEIETTQRSHGSSQWKSIAASLIVFVLGGIGGYYLNENSGTSQAIIADGGWLRKIADYHAIYEKQKRHLVEVPGSEVKHIEKWLGKTIATNFSVPDLSEHKVNFEGARLLVIQGKPVAQLIYKESDGTVIALCFKKRAAEKVEMPSNDFKFKTTSINKFDFVSWKTDKASFTVVGPHGKTNLKEIATLAANRI